MVRYVSRKGCQPTVDPLPSEPPTPTQAEADTMKGASHPEPRTLPGPLPTKPATPMQAAADAIKPGTHDLPKWATLGLTAGESALLNLLIETIEDCPTRSAADRCCVRPWQSLARRR